MQQECGWLSTLNYVEVGSPCMNPNSCFMLCEHDVGE